MAQYNIDQIKRSVRLEEVAGHYVKLSRRGKLFIGLCPFHADHHPSLTVDPQKQTFTCYACGEHGDVIAFVQKAEKCSFAEAVEKLSPVTSLPMTHPLPPLERGKVTPGPINEKTECPMVSPSPLERGQGVCYLTVQKNNQFLQALLPYACGDSDLTPAYLDFEVGVSPGMVPKEWYKMRNRVIFPLRDEMGGLIGFAARKQPDGDPDEPKYRNTSVEEGYRKSENLYALNLAKEAIRQDGFAFVVEGYKDAIAMHAAGFRNTVALCGTAMCDGHVALLKRYTSQVTVLLDGDRAGEKGSTEAVAILRREGLWAVKGQLPAGEDPDSLFRLWGKEAFVSFIRGLRKQLLSSEEVALFNRISRQVQLLLQKHNAGERKVLLSDLTKMFAYRTGLSLRDGHPATLDWRWL